MNYQTIIKLLNIRYAENTLTNLVTYNTYLYLKLNNILPV
jgi:hypothetical protein